MYKGGNIISCSVIYIDTWFIVVECNSEAVRLVNPRSDLRKEVNERLLSGRVEICVNGTFRSICDKSWTDQEAALLCKELGFSQWGKNLI